ncbi:hypothetical protein TNCT_464031 [Trichonephila clavata]|uniref:C2H2-type domain-containing protein n=1 Tax=Trichonephila clavata TaxID=2740835 RepID=A0A8X6LCU9_TRICU|nr:hypothetical protein TNCT_464031 [Trichonephila clavata]
MKECNVNPSEGGLFYFCADCAPIRREAGLFTCVSSFEMFFNCIACGKTFRHGFLSKNMDSSNAPYHRYKNCGEIFVTSTQLLHPSYNHSGAWPYSCSGCTRGFADSTDLELHMRQREFCCNKCSKTFLEKFALKCIVILLLHISCVLRRVLRDLTEYLLR